ncbi:uncharacterized protein LOC114882845 [Osmia bicornis bicornis]|uniref:uncharacterized protein LOC114882845 n=1 Tax=Osmia bicornis bicornis TaxID=1437191 RepID=UPI0010F85D5A|nr:uncharacterized protein LOC114882845 [Osmia bicornis bicornis]XP_029055780.1 uncharacterized protein LOC114882845 [Osmia bicornis bicornis]XP_046144869.1 uncharacterized protein LOC114882845 [Osmia bicornis bicornis]
MKLINIMALDSILSNPREETYQIRKSVLAQYLMQCKKGYPSTKIQCPFDAFHLIDENYFEHHILNCASSGNVKELYNFQSTNEVGSVPLKTVKELSVPLMEDWKEENVEVYNPWESTEKRNIIRCLLGATKSQRKLFKLTERRRIKNLEKLGIIDSNLTNNFKYKKLGDHIKISNVMLNLKRLALDDFDTLVQNIDIGKLVLSDVNNTVNQPKEVPCVVEEILVQKFKKQMLCYLKK